jgi:cell division protein FtsW
MYQKSHDPDIKLILMVIFLVVFGLVVLSSAGAVVGFQRFQDSYFYLKKQTLFGLIPGVIAAVIFSKIPYQWWKKVAFPLYVGSILLLLLVFIPGIGTTHNTVSRSWINFFGYSLQPSEIVKLGFLLYLATWLESRGEKRVRDFSEGMVPFLLLLSIIIFLMVLQPDLGTLTVIVFTSLAVYFVAGARMKHLLLLSVSGFSMLVLFIKMAPDRLARLTIFLHPEIDPKGIGYHMNQAFLAIASGGIFGRGFGQSRQKFNFLPEVTGDSIFAIMSEELGFILMVFFLVFILCFAYRGYRIAQRAPDLFGKLTAAGIMSWLLFQGFVNIGAMVGILPLTGLPLPFISYGGTALMINLAAVGILVNISKFTKQ